MFEHQHRELAILHQENEMLTFDDAQLRAIGEEGAFIAAGRRYACPLNQSQLRIDVAWNQNQATGVRCDVRLVASTRASILAWTAGCYRRGGLLRR